MLINKHNLDVVKFVSKEVSRYTLQAIEISDKGTTATDGHSLVRVSLPATESKNFPGIEGFAKVDALPEPLLLSADAAKKLQSAIPRSNTLPILAHVAIGQPTETTLQFAVTDLDTPQIFKPRKPTGQFPNADAVIPKKDAKFTIRLNASKLAALSAAAAAFSDDDAEMVTLSFYSSHEVMKLEASNQATGQTWMALLMPLRG